MRRLLFLLIVAGALWGAPGAFAATWCGTGESPTDRPDVTTGAQIHAIYVIPADGADTFANGANEMATDIASITSWWQGQDPTRIPRFDAAAFPAGTCADISFVRLSKPGTFYAMGASQAFALVENELANAGFDDPYKKYLVYYDGPSIEDGVCGTGAGSFDSGPAFAVVWLAGCGPDYPTDAIAAHELLHALGALPAGAPNACTVADDPFGVADSAHPCDSATDVLYPEASPDVPLSSLVLDYNHDDYYAHSGSWPDIQDSIWMHLLNVPAVPLALTITGSGGAYSDLPGLVCIATCTTQWDQGTTVQLSAVPNRGSRFIGWTGACAGPDVCSLDLKAAAAATAVFGPARISVKATTAGRGTVYCAPRCSSTFKAGTALNLIAQPAKGWRFLRWSGACKGTQPICRPLTNYSLVAKATFKKKPVVKKKKR